MVPAPEPPPHTDAAPEPPFPGPDSNPGAQETPEPAGDRLRAVWLAAEDGTRQRVHAIWYDTDLAAECSFVLAGDGVLRCLPAAGANTAGLFLSSACAPDTRLFIRSAVACQVGSPDIGADPGTACPNTTRLFRIRPYTGSVWAQGSGGECVAAEPLVGFAYYERVGSELLPTRFVAATREVD